jgi:hypothetical protein
VDVVWYQKFTEGLSMKLHTVIQLIPSAVSGAGSGPAAEVCRGVMSPEECAQLLIEHLSAAGVELESGSCIVVTIQREQVRPAEAA